MPQSTDSQMESSSADADCEGLDEYLLANIDPDDQIAMLHSLACNHEVLVDMCRIESGVWTVGFREASRMAGRLQKAGDIDPEDDVQDIYLKVKDIEPCKGTFKDNSEGQILYDQYANKFALEVKENRRREEERKQLPIFDTVSVFKMEIEQYTRILEFVKTFPHSNSQITLDEFILSLKKHPEVMTKKFKPPYINLKTIRDKTIGVKDYYTYQGKILL